MRTRGVLQEVGTKTLLVGRGRRPFVTRYVVEVVSVVHQRRRFCVRRTSKLLVTLLTKVTQLGQAPRRRVLCRRRDEDVEVVSSALSCVSSRCERGVGVRRLSTGYRLDRSRFHEVFSKYVRVDPMRCVGLVHIHATYRGLGGASESIASVNARYNFTSSSTFGQGFQGLVKVSPTR